MGGGEVGSREGEAGFGGYDGCFHGGYLEAGDAVGVDVFVDAGGDRGREVMGAEAAGMDDRCEEREGDFLESAA